MYLSIYLSFYLSIYLPDGRANPLMDRQVVGMSNYPFVYPSIHPSGYRLSFFSLHWSICLSTYPSLCLSIHLLSSLSVYAAVHPLSHFWSMCPSVYLSRSVQFPVSLCVLLSIHRSSCLSGHPAIHSIHLSTKAFHQSIYLVLVFPPGQCNSKQAGNICTDKTQSEQTLGFSRGVTYKT